jgi:hypothetical protein
MPKTEWTLSRRIELCSHIVPLIQSGLPIDRGLKSLAGDLPRRLTNIAESVQSGLENGQTLATTLAVDASPPSRSLSATIEAGELSNELATLLESWASLHSAMGLARKRFRLKLVYPVCLIVITVVAIGIAIHSLVPQYRASLLTIHAEVPNWFQPIEWLHRYLIAWGIATSLVCIAPILYFAWRRNTLDRRGYPREPAYQTRLQSHAATVALKLVQSKVPSDQILSLTIASLGLTSDGSNLLDPTTHSVCDLLRQGILEPDKAITMLQDIAHYLLDRSQFQIESQGRRLVHSVSISVALAVGLSYLLVVYLPWLYLLDQLKQFLPIR